MKIQLINNKFVFALSYSQNNECQTNFIFYYFFPFRKMDPANKEIEHLVPVYLSAGCNRVPNCLSWRNDLIVYGSSNALVLVKKLG